MAEMSTPESTALVRRVYARAQQDCAEGLTLSAPVQMLYEIEMLSREVTGAVSFEHYFRWATLVEIGRAAQRLEALGLPEAARLARRAVATGFPSGLPASEVELDECLEWTPEQQRHLAELARAFSQYSGAITNALARFYRQSLAAPA